MPNYCWFQMKVKGRKEDIETLHLIMNNAHERRMGRTFNADLHNLKDVEDGLSEAYISGECAWSVVSSLMENRSGSYNGISLSTYRYNLLNLIIELAGDKIDIEEYNRLKEELEESTKETSLLRESELLNLIIEVYSSEEGMGFEEHYLMAEGTLYDETEKATETLDLNDYETLEELNNEKGTNYTEEEFDEDGRLRLGGFEEWTYL